jgi:YebC/PmpR family DNA-binding regulatory protein
MSGHSKWHSIQKKKGVADTKRGQIFTKLAKAIAIAAKAGGGGDPNFNFQLRVAIDSAKAANMPKDKIDRAVSRGTGEGDDIGQIEEVIYEGFGPGGSAILIQCLTDNRNRSVADVRTVMNKKGGNLGSQGTVMWMFNHKGQIVLSGELTDDLEMRLIEAGAEDIQSDNGLIQVVTTVPDLKNVLDGVNEKVEHAGLAYFAKDPVKIEGADSESLDRLVDALDELDDVDTVFTNVI